MTAQISNRVFLLLGSNMGDRMKMLNSAMERIASDIGVILAQSSVYESEPWGFQSERKFLNKAIEVMTSLAPPDLLSEIQIIERWMGRRRTDGIYRSRKIDIDIMFYNYEIINDHNLVIPHPLMKERRFALVPLAEIAGEMKHPVMNKTVSDILSECQDHSLVTRIDRE